MSKYHQNVAFPNRIKNALGLILLTCDQVDLKLPNSLGKRASVGWSQMIINIMSSRKRKGCLYARDLVEVRNRRRSSGTQLFIPRVSVWLKNVFSQASGDCLS